MRAKTLRQMLSEPEPVVAPGAYDALSARLAEQAGFEAVYMTGFGASASLLGHPDIGLLSFAEMVEKVRAAVEARREVLIIARTDARAVEGLDAALSRAEAYREAGADVLFVEAPENEDEIAAVAAAFPGVPLVFNRVDGGRTPLLSLDRIAELGFSLVILPVTTLFAAAAAVRDTLARLRAGGGREVPLQFDEFTDLIGLPDAQRLERRYTV